MSISKSYFVLNDKNIQRLEKFNLDIDNIFSFSRNGDLNLYFRAEKISLEIKTEFNQVFYLSKFMNYSSQDRTYDKFFSVADYNIDTGKHRHTELGGNLYHDGEDLRMIHFEGFIQIPSRAINESEQKILLDEYSSYRFLGDESGYTNTDFILNFSFPNHNLEIPIRNTYILVSDIFKLAQMNLITIPNEEDNNKDCTIAELQAKITELENQLQAQQSAVNSEPILEYEGDLPESTNADKLADFISLIIDPELLDNGKLPTYSTLHTRLGHRYKDKRKIPSKNTIAKYINQC
ncbi:hypothetical protein BKK50_07520 [Rodentibacter rarus]|uniref:Uncharacterized protein n=1 Tax=Rodentibacter rarus TaxID=1908260 RepID=A0A1V3IKZ2_9PAST|nr:hypothetical protein [Rodentibacter rarus]OOF42090.1 hypothetical protein BKK50_07520 [Rodentibacter rarus]